MCEYLAGGLRSASLSSDATLSELRAIAKRSGYYVQLGAEIPPPIRKEILRYVPESGGFVLFNVTSRDGPNWDCIDETLDSELDFSRKKPVEEVAFFAFLRRAFAFSNPDEAIVIYTEGASTGWFPLERRTCSLADFLESLYEYHDRPDRDVAGVYVITAEA